MGEDELRKSKQQLKSSLLLGMESTTSRMNSLAKYEIYFGRHFGIEKILAGIESVTPRQIQELAQELFQSNLLNLVLLGPHEAIHLDEQLLQC